MRKKMKLKSIFYKERKAGKYKSGAVSRGTTFARPKAGESIFPHFCVLVRGAQWLSANIIDKAIAATGSTVNSST